MRSLTFSHICELRCIRPYLGNGAGCFEVKVWANTAKFTDVTAQWITQLALAARRQYVYVRFSQRKIPRSSAARWQPREDCKVP